MIDFREKEQKKYIQGEDGHTYCKWIEVNDRELVVMIGHLDCEKCEVAKEEESKVKL